MKLLKEIDEIKIKHYAKMERTGKVSQYKVWWNILPVFLFKKQLIALSVEVSKLISDNELDSNIKDKEWQAITLNKIERLEGAYVTILAHTRNGVQLQELIQRLEQTRRIRRKTELSGRSLPLALDIIKTINGKKIENDEDLENLRKNIVRRKDKYNELYNKEVKKTEKVTIMQSAGTYFGYMDQEFKNIPEITIMALAELKRQAEEKNKAQQRQLDKLNNK